MDVFIAFYFWTRHCHVMVTADMFFTAACSVSPKARSTFYVFDRGVFFPRYPSTCCHFFQALWTLWNFSYIVENCKHERSHESLL